MITLSKIKTLEKKLKQRAKLERTEVLVIPDNWVEFARMTKIRSAGNVVFFNPFEYQIKLVELMLEHSVCVVKSRQLGISETILCFMLWRACRNPGYLGLVFSKTQTDSSLLARRMKRMIESLGLKTATENLSDIEIKGLGRILFRNSKPDSARGIESVVDVFLDELAFLETAKEVYDALAPAQQMVGDKARVFAVSTPNGKSGFYWDLLANANGDKDIELMCSQVSKSEAAPFQHWIDSGGWGKVLIHWKAHPVYGSRQDFLKQIHEKQKLTWATIEQEYNLNFQESDVNYFSADVIRACANGSYEEYEKSSDYFIGIDTATTGDDYGVCVVLKKDNSGIFSLVHLYRKRRESSEYHIYQMSNIIDTYKPQIVAIETTGGTGVIYLENLSKFKKSSSFEAIRTTGDSKPAMLDRVKLLLEQRKFIYPANCPIVDEMLNFKRDGKRLEAGQGKHDDVIMSCAFALAVGESYTNPWRMK